MAYILIQRAQKRHNLIEKPLKMADFLQYLLWRPYAKIYQKDTRNLQVLIKHRPTYWCKELKNVTIS